MGKVKEFVKKNRYIIGIGVGSAFLGGALAAMIPSSKATVVYNRLCEFNGDMPSKLLEMSDPATMAWCGVALREMSVYEGLNNIMNRGLIPDDKNITGLMIFRK